MPILNDIPQTWYVLQANVVGGGSVRSGPYFNEADAIAEAKKSCLKDPGVPYITVKTTNCFVTGDPVVSRIPVVPQAGALPNE
jgi:hypothetical protein